MDSRSLSMMRNLKYYVNPYTNLKTIQTSSPLIFGRGKGIYVYDENGKEYIEGMSGLWCVASFSVRKG